MLRAPIILLINFFSLLGHLWSSFWFKLGYFFRRKKKLYVRLDLESSYPFGPREGLARYFQHKPSFLELRDSLERLRDDKTVAGVLLVTESSAMGHGRVTELRRLLDGLRESGKHVVAHAQMPMSGDYMTLTSADEILLSPAGRLYSFGPRFEQYFLHEALEKLGVVPQFIHIGEFKTASHRFIHEQMPQAQRLMMESLYKCLKALLIERISRRRAIEPTAADQLFEQAPLDCRQARRAGFIDGEVFREALDDWLEGRDEVTPIGMQFPAEPESSESKNSKTSKKTKNARETLLLRADDYLDSLPKPYRWRPLFRRPKSFAVLDLSGMIVMPNMNVPGQGSVVIDPHEVVPALKKIRDNPAYAGAILHINSPGGSALASDIIWHAIEQLRRVKPVVAQCSDVVGSGGYYLAVACDEIICERATLTGSIGVITGKMSAPGIPGKIGVNFESIYEHDADNFSSLTHPLSPEMMERMDQDARGFYRRFLQRVGQSRQLPRRRLHRYARGRVYLGDAAQKRGLVDHIGGIDLAVERLAGYCEIDKDKAKLSYISHRKESLKSALRGSLFSTPSLGDAIGDSIAPYAGDWLANFAEPALIAALLKQDPILALMPWRIR
jgi:protease-4